jgi:hypothetical protein
VDEILRCWLRTSRRNPEWESVFGGTHSLCWSPAPRCSIQERCRRTPVAVRHAEGLVHGFLVLRTVAGETLADGDLIQVARSDQVTSRLVFRFKDGSVHDETAVFSQRRNFRLLSAPLRAEATTQCVKA